MSTGATKQLARYAVNLRYRDIPPEVISRAKDCLLDIITVALYGSTKPWSRTVVQFVKDQGLRDRRHRAIMRALRDSLVSPDGALVATMLPHLTGLQGVITVRTGVGRSPLYSALDSDFVTRLSSMADDTCKVYPFETVDAFYNLMNDFIATSVPALHPFWRTAEMEQ